MEDGSRRSHFIQGEGAKVIKSKRLLFIAVLIFGLFSGSFAYSEMQPGPMEDDIDRPGIDYKDFDLPLENPKLCEDACREDFRCRAYTYVRANVQKAGIARCWLKLGVPSPVKNTCCTSGVMQGEPTTSFKIETLKEKVAPSAKPDVMMAYFQPDLIVKDITLTKDCELQFTVKNIGKGGLTQNFVAAHYVPGYPITAEEYAKFPPGKLQNADGEETYVFPFYQAPAVYVITVVVNPDRLVKEGNYNNNSLTKNIKCSK